MLVFSPDGRTLATSTENSVTLLDVPRIVGGSAPVKPAELPRLWDDLASDDAANRYKAQCRLILAGPDAVGFLEGKLKPVAAPPAHRLTRLLRDLDSGSFPVRQQATQELAKLGQAAVPALRNAQKGMRTPESRRRIESVLAAQPEARQDRALDVLESLSAQALLQTLAGGLSGAPLTEKAGAALERVKARTGGS